MPTRKQPTDEEMKAKALSRWENEGGALANEPGKRRRDPNQLAKRIVDIATGDVDDTPPDDGKDKAAQALGRKGGQKRAEGMTAEQRAEAAHKAAETRWVKK